MNVWVIRNQYDELHSIWINESLARQQVYRLNLNDDESYWYHWENWEVDSELV